MPLVTDIATILANDPAIKAIVQDRVMDLDFRISQWEGAINYKNDPIDIIDDFDYIRPCIVVDDQGYAPERYRRRSDTFIDSMAIWVFVPAGRTGATNLLQLRRRIHALLHMESLPTRKVMRIAQVDGTLSDGNALFDRIDVRVTHLGSEDKNNA